MMVVVVWMVCPRSTKPEEMPFYIVVPYDKAGKSW